MNHRRHRTLVLPLFAVVLAAAVAAAPALAEEWAIDPSHSSAQFKVRHMMVSNVTGGFSKVTGMVQYDPAAPEKSIVEATIDATTISSSHDQRDNHLKSPDFFDVAKFPTITFKSKKVEKAGDGKLKVTGDLTLKGVTKEVVLEVDGPVAPIKGGQGGMMSGASASTKINRQDFGVSWSKALDGGGLVVSDEVQITIDVELKQKKQD